MKLIEQIARAIAPYLEGGREFDQMPNGEEAKRAWYRANMCGLNDATKEDAIAAAQAILPLIEAAVLAERERCAGVADELAAERDALEARVRELEGAASVLLKVCHQLDANEELPPEIDGSMLDAVSEALELRYPIIWTPEQVEMLKARQDSPMHPYTCGGDRSDKLHRAIAEEDGTEPGQLYPTVRGWKCPACDYRQFWAHETGGPDAARKALHDPR